MNFRRTFTKRKGCPATDETEIAGHLASELAKRVRITLTPGELR